LAIKVTFEALKAYKPDLVDLVVELRRSVGKMLRGACGSWPLGARALPGLLPRAGRRLQSGSATRERLMRLEEEANVRATDAVAQEQFLREISTLYPQIVVQRVQSGRFAANEGVFREYQRAVSSMSHRTDLSSGFQPSYGTGYGGNYAANYAAGYSAYAQPMQTNGFAGAASSTSGANPIQVQIVEGSFRSQMWRTARFVAFGVLLYMGFNMFMDGKGMPRGFGVGAEVKPMMEETGKRFDDVCGAAEAKEELDEIVQYLKDPARFTRLGGKLPKGVLLTGPPGTGKTLLAKAIAGEAGVPFFYSAGSDFEEMYVGVGARRVRDLFDAAKRSSPCIVFIDEIDAIGSTRALKEQQALKMTLNQLLVELDGFRDSEGVIIIGATNFPEVLDPALVRPGRFDRNVVVPLPDLRDRQEILDLYLSKVPHEEGVDPCVIARGTPGASGADLANIVNVAALHAAKIGADMVTAEHLEYAKDKVLMGSERKSAVIPKEVQQVTAYHEGGHALVAIHTLGAMPIHKATIMPRGQALGMVHQLPEEGDMLQRTKKQMLAELDVCMGGRAAEELIFGPDSVTSGASSDIQKASQIARAMVERYGMGEETGITFVAGNGRDQQTISNETKQKVDEEVKLLLHDSYERAKALLKGRKRELDRLASALLENESLTAEHIQLVINGKPLPPALKKQALRKRPSKAAAAGDNAGTIPGKGKKLPA